MDAVQDYSLRFRVRVRVRFRFRFRFRVMTSPLESHITDRYLGFGRHLVGKTAHDEGCDTHRFRR